MKMQLTIAVIFAVLLIPQLDKVVHAQEGTSVRAEFDDVFSQWKEVIDGMRQLQVQAEVTEDDQLAPLKEQYASLVMKGKELLPQLRSAAVKAYEAAPNQDREISRWLVALAKEAVESDRYDEAAPVLQVLLDGGCEDKTIYDLAGVAAFANHDFEKAQEYMEEAQAAGVLSSQGQGMLSDAADYIQYWKEEQEIREKEANAADDQLLPQVSLETSQGKIVLELFENEAPETVGNFVSLVEKGFYDGLTFHRVLPGFMAQAGCPEGTGQGGPGYEIYCECYQPNYRKHFRGSLSMAKGQGRDSGGSQFFLTFVPTTHLNGRHTVFGRIIEGMDVLPKLQRRDPDKPEDVAKVPDTIVKAEVIRKRDHKYVPRKTK